MTRNQKHFKITDQHFGLNKIFDGRSTVMQILEMHKEKPLKYTSEYGSSDWRHRCDSEQPDLNDIFRDSHQIKCEIISHNQVEITTTEYEPPRYGYIESSGFWRVYKRFVVTVPAKFLYSHFKYALHEASCRIQEEEDRQREENRIKNRRNEIFEELFKGNTVETS